MDGDGELADTTEEEGEPGSNDTSDTNEGSIGVEVVACFPCAFDLAGQCGSDDSSQGHAPEEPWGGDRSRPAAHRRIEFGPQFVKQLQCAGAAD